MQKVSVQTFTALLLSVHLSVPATAAPVIGIITARGHFQVNSLRVANHASLLDGAKVETTTAASELRFLDGSRLTLAPGSKGSVYKTRAVLERGAGQLSSASGYGAEIGAYYLQPNGNSTARFELLAFNRLRVSAEMGAFTITNGRGVVLANLAAGNSMQLDGTTPSVKTKITGKLTKMNGKYQVLDEATNTTVELLGEGLEKLVGQRVEVTGTMTGNTVTVTSVSALAAGGVSTTAIVAGVIIASGAGVGLGVGLTQEEEQQTTSR